MMMTLDLILIPKTEAVTEVQENAEVAEETGAHTGADKDAFEAEDNDD